MLMILIKFLSGIAAAGLVVFTSFQWGKAAERGDHLAELAKLKEDHTVAISVAEAEAYRRGRTDTDRRITNAEIIDDIAETADASPSADNVCWDADFVEQLRQLQ